MSGRIDERTGAITLNPDRWISRPEGYVMVGLSGVYSGAEIRGSIVGGYACGDFLLSRQSMRISEQSPSMTSVTGVPPTNLKSSIPSTKVPAPPVSLKSSSPSMLVPLHRDGGTFTVPVTINGDLTLGFTIDSGATDVSIPADVVLTLIRTGSITDNDFLGTQVYVLADGSKVPSQTFRIRSLKVGGRILDNVIAAVGSVRGRPLLGQSFLRRFNSWSIDNKRQVLKLK